MAILTTVLYRAGELRYLLNDKYPRMIMQLKQLCNEFYGVISRWQLRRAQIARATFLPEIIEVICQPLLSDEFTLLSMRLVSRAFSQPEHLKRMLEIKQSQMKVVKVAAGSCHSMVLKNGEVFTCGKGKYGVLGHENYHTRPMLERVDALAGKFVTDIEAGSSHSVCLTSNGEVYTFGIGAALGHGENLVLHTPRIVVALEGQFVIKIFATNNTTCFLTAEGTGYFCGDDSRSGFPTQVTHHEDLVKLVSLMNRTLTLEKACLGDDGKIYLRTHAYRWRSRELANRLEATHGKAVMTAIGSSHSLILNVQGLVYADGRNMYGQLGLGHFNSDDSDSEEDRTQIMPCPGQDIEAMQLYEERLAALNNG